MDIGLEVGEEIQEETFFCGFMGFVMFLLTRVGRRNGIGRLRSLAVCEGELQESSKLFWDGLNIRIDIMKRKVT